MGIDIIEPARRAGCRISIGTDSHGLSRLEFIEFSLVVALKANITPDRILNFMSRDDLTRWAARLRDRGGNP
jgi:histidinol phosphatase-like PHP family hydrolase